MVLSTYDMEVHYAITDRETILVYAQFDGFILQQASDQLRDDKEIVDIAVRSNGSALKYASKRLRDDYDIVLAAVVNSGQALQYASDRLFNDKTIVGAAISQDGWVFSWVPDLFRNDKELIEVAVSSYNYTWRHAPSTLKSERELAVRIILTGNQLLHNWLHEYQNRFKYRLLENIFNPIESIIPRNRPTITHIAEVGQLIKKYLLYEPEFVRRVYILPNITHPKIVKCMILDRFLSNVLTDLIIMLL